MAPIFQRVREDGFTIVKEWMRKMWPQREAFSKVTFVQGELAQLDWREYGSIGIGSTRRQRSFFVLVGDAIGPGCWVY